MRTKIKQQIIGALVLAALLAVCLPLLFHHRFPSLRKGPLSTTRPTLLKSKPVKSYVYDLPLAGQKPVASVKQDESTEKMRIRASDTDEISARILRTHHVTFPKKNDKKQCTGVCAGKPKMFVTAPVVTQRSVAHKTRDFGSKEVSLHTVGLNLPGAWVVQVASFSQRSIAGQLVTKLRKQGLDVFSKHFVNRHGAKVTRVYVGPYINERKAQRLQRQLLVKMRLKGIVKKYVT